MALWATRLAKLAQALGTVGQVPDTKLSTAETDTSMRLAPDGANGVEFVAGGGGVGNMWSMSLSASQTLTNGAATTITWDRNDIDGGESCIDLANDRFVVPTTGFYQVLFSWLWEGTAPLVSCAMQVNVNGTNEALLRVPAQTAATAVFATNSGYNGAASLTLTAGDFVTGLINPQAVTGVTARGNAARALSTVITLVRIT